MVTVSTELEFSSSWDTAFNHEVVFQSPISVIRGLTINSHMTTLALVTVSVSSSEDTNHFTTVN